MSKALSANIHDPNHAADDYDLYFNGELIESGGSGFNFAAVTLNVSESTPESLVINIPSDVGEHFSIYATCIGTGQYAAPSAGSGKIISIYVNDSNSTSPKTGISFTPAGNGSLTAIGLSCVRSENKLTITSLAGSMFPFADFSTSFTGYITY